MTERLVIRPYTEEDFEPLYAFFSDEEATRLLDMTPEQKSAEGTRALLDTVISSYETEDPIFAMVIAEKGSGKYLGSCGMAPDEETPDTQMFYTLLPEHQGKGYATEAVMRLIEHAFVDLGLEKLVASMASENVPSVKLAKRVGMVLEGSTEREVGGIRYEGRRYGLCKNQFLD